MKNILLINVKGNNIERFIKRLHSNNIELLKILIKSKDEVNLKIYNKDYEKILKLKTIYEINILNYYGLIRLKNNILTNKFIILFIMAFLIIIYILSNVIFSIDVITNDSKMEKDIRITLEELGISKYKFKINYNKLQLIKKEILSKYKNKIEWIEIENIGTKYIVKYEPRIINDDIKEENLRNIIASKDAVIHSMKISNGQIIKGVNSYVKKGDIIVSGYIYMNDNIKDTVSSDGIVYGETWYTATLTYPYKYYEEKITDNSKNVLVIKFLNKEIEVFNFNKYKIKKVNNKTIFKNNILPIKLVNQKQIETKIINENYTKSEVINKAINYSKEKINKNLKTNEFIKDYKILNKSYNNNSVSLKIFFSIVEDITEYQYIEKYEEKIE